jgi:hypothetical protein
MLLDHGCDVFTNICVLFNISHLVRLGNNTLFVQFLIITLFLGFYATTYEEYVLEEMHLGIINGPDEGNFLIATGSLICFLLGNDFWIFKIECLNMTIGEFIIFLNFNASYLTAVFPLYYHVIKRKGFKKFMALFLHDFILFTNVILFPGIYLFINEENYSKYLTLILFFVALLYSKMTIQLQLCICTGDKNYHSFDSILSNIIILINYIYPNEKFLVYSIICSMIIVGTNLIKLIYIRSNEILNYLNIRFLVIPYKKKEKNN